MPESYSVRAILSAVDQSFSSTLARAGQATQSFGANVNQKMQGVGKAMTVAGAAATAMGTKALKGFGDFQQTLNTTAVVAGGTSKNIDELSRLANKMGEDLPLSAQDAANAMLEMARNGASLEDIKKQFPAIAEASTAAGSDLQTTAGVVQQSMNIWSDSLKSPQQAAAILVQTANASNASIEDMQQALATIGSTAKMAGMDMGTTSEAIGLLTNRGFSAAQASDDLNHAITQMLAPSSVAQKEMDALGLSFVDASGKMKPFPQILQEIADKTNGMGEAQKTAALKAMFGASGMKAIAPLLDAINNKTGNAARSWTAYAAEQDKAAGSTQRATQYLSKNAAEMQKNVGASLEQVGGAWESLRNTSMQSAKNINGQYLSMIKNALDWATQSKSGTAQVIRAFIGLSPVIGTAVTALGGFITNAGKIISVAGAVASGIGNLGKVFIILKKAANVTEAVASLSKLAKTSAVAKAAMMGLKAGSAIFNGLKAAAIALSGGLQALWGVMLANPITIVIAAIAAVVAALVLFFTKTKTGRKLWGEFVQYLQQAWNNLKEVASTVWNAIGNTITTVINTVKSVWSGITSFFSGLWNGIVNTAKEIWNGFAQFFSPVVEAVKNIWNGIKEFFSNLWQGIVSTAHGVWSSFTQGMTPIVESIKTLWGSLKDFFSTLWQGIITAAQTIWQGLVTIFSPIVDAIKTVWQGLGEFFSTLWQGIVTVAQTVWGGFVAFFTPIVEGIKTVWQGLTEFFSTLWQGIVTTAQAIWQQLVTVVQTVWTNIQTVVQTAIQVLSTVIQTGMQVIQTIWTTIWNVLSTIVQTIWTNISTIISTTINAIAGVIQAVTAAIQGNWSGAWNAIKGVAITVWNGIKAVVTNTINGIRSVITSVMNGIRSVMNSVWNAIKSITSSVWNGIKSVVSSSMNAMRSTISSMMNSIRSAFVSGWNAARSATSSGIRSAVSIVRSAASSMVSAGRNFVMGFVNGIRSMIGAAVAAAASMARAAVSAARSFLHIHSPSRVMRDQVGYYVAAGMAVGIANNTGMVEKAANKMAQSAIPTIDLGASINGVMAQSDLNRTINGTVNHELKLNQQPAYINVSLGGTDYGTFVDDISREQGNQAMLKKNYRF